ncbi:SIS domain-containing protein [Porticoccaceae bacterium]|nr:SIS domain-containing protein [Porticoccaceae bacterium]
MEIRTMDQVVFQHLQNHIEATMAMGENCAPKIAEAAENITQALLAGHKIYSCGIGEKAPASQLLVQYLTAGFEIERPGFPAIDLLSLINGTNHTDGLSNALHIHGNNSDVLIVFSAQENHGSLIKTVETAVEKGMMVVSIVASTESLLMPATGSNHIEINCGESSSKASAAMNFLIIQCLCKLIDSKIFGEN